MLPIIHISSEKENRITERLQIFLEEQIRQDEFSGAVLIARDGVPIFEKAVGFANKENHIPNTIQTQFNLGSINKVFTAVAIVQLVQAGKLKFDDPIGKYVSQFPPDVADKLTIVFLLTHKDGLSSYFNDKFIEKRLQLNTVDDFIDLIKDEPLLFEPGTKYQYSNSGYVVLGAIIEAVTNQFYDNYVKNSIFEVSGMPKTGFPRLDDGSPDIAIGYTLRRLYSRDILPGPRHENTEELPQRGSPAGGGYSTCRDLLQFSRALLHNKLMNSEMTQMLMTPKVEIETKNNQTLYYGYGFQIVDLGNGLKRIGHAGVAAGVNARFDMYPDLGITVIVLSNYDAPAAFKIADKVTELITSVVN